MAWSLYAPFSLGRPISATFLMAAVQVLGDTQDADFPIFRNNTGKVRPAARKPDSALKVIRSLLGQDTGVITVSTTVFDLNDGSVKVHSSTTTTAVAELPFLLA